MRFLNAKALAPILILSAVTSAHAAFTVDMAKAREFLSAGLYQEALPLLEEAATEIPDSAEAHLLLGVAKLWTRDCDSACTSFTKALELDPDLAPRVSAQIRDRVVDRIRAGDFDEARKAVSVAVRHDHRMRTEIARSCLYQGEGYLDSGEEAAAEDLFRFVAEVEPELKTRICDLLYTKARSVAGEESLRLVIASMHYGDRYQKEAEKMVFRLANDLDDEDARQRYLRMTEDFIEERSVLQASVDYYSVLYGPPVKVSLFTPGAWVSSEKPRTAGRVRYLTADPVLTRGDTGPRALETSVYRALEFPGTATPSGKAYTDEIWFSTASDQGLVYYWTVPSP